MEVHDPSSHTQQIQRCALRAAVILAVLCLAMFACKDKSTEPSGTGPGFTAKTRLSDVSALADSYYPGARFFRAFTSTVDTNGKASQWSYCYVDTSGSHPLYYFHATSTQVAYDSTSPSYAGPSVITLHWFDSDSAIFFGEQNGGSAYRLANTDCWITADLSQTLTPNPRTVWSVIYHSANSIMLGLMIDANTGALIGQTR